MVSAGSMRCELSFSSDLIPPRLSVVPWNERLMLTDEGTDKASRVLVTRWWMLTGCSSVTEHVGASRAQRAWAGEPKNASQPTPPRRHAIHISGCSVHHKGPRRLFHASKMTWHELRCDLSDRSERPGRERHFISTRIATTRIRA